MITGAKSCELTLTADDVLTKEDLMEILHIQSDKALKLMKSQMLDSIKIGKQYLTTKKWLSDFFNNYKNTDVDI
jgi:hypothetical protein